MQIIINPIDYVINSSFVVLVISKLLKAAFLVSVKHAVSKRAKALLILILAALGTLWEPALEFDKASRRTNLRFLLICCSCILFYIWIPLVPFFLISHESTIMFSFNFPVTCPSAAIKFLVSRKAVF